MFAFLIVLFLFTHENYVLLAWRKKSTFSSRVHKRSVSRNACLDFFSLHSNSETFLLHEILLNKYNLSQPRWRLKVEFLNRKKTGSILISRWLDSFFFRSCENMAKILLCLTLLVISTFTITFFCLELVHMGKMLPLTWQCCFVSRSWGTRAKRDLVKLSLYRKLPVSWFYRTDASRLEFIRTFTASNKGARNLKFSIKVNFHRLEVKCTRPWIFFLS